MDQKSEETLFVKLSWNTKNFEPLSPEVLSALKKLEDSPEYQKPRSRYSTSRSCQTPSHPVSPSARKLLEFDGKHGCKVVFNVLRSFVIHQFFLPQHLLHSDVLAVSMVGFSGISYHWNQSLAFLSGSLFLVSFIWESFLLLSCWWFDPFYAVLYCINSYSLFIPSRWHLDVSSCSWLWIKPP